MRKYFVVFMITFALLFASSTVSYAEEDIKETELLEETESLEQFPSQEELEYLSVKMEDYDIGGEVTGEILYNRFNIPKFLMGITENGYMILYRDTLEFLQCGEGSSPYSEVDSSESKYYGGFECYSISDGDKYFDLERKEVVNEIPYMPALDEIESGKASRDMEAVSDVGDQSLALARGTSIPPKKLVDSYEYIQRMAFGNNNDDSCTAVAIQIILNYLDRKVNTDFVPNDMHSEKLNSQTFYNSSGSLQYPQSNSLHRYLVDTCKMTGPCYADGVINGLSKYRNKSREILNTEISVDWTLTNVEKYIVNQIDMGKPSMITTTFGNGRYNLHTMVAYGYKIVSNNIDSILVHRGWYGVDRVEEDINNYRRWIQTEEWLTPKFINYAYKFNYTTNPMNLSKPTVSSKSLSPTSTQINWKAVRGAKYYRIYYAKSPYTSYVYIKTVNAPKRSWIHNGLKSNVIYKYKIVAAKKVYGKELLTEESSITSVRTLAKYRIEYNVNGGKGLPPKAQIKIEGKKLNLRVKKPTRKGHCFVGWSTDPKAKYATYKAGGTYKVNASVILYAVWRLPKQYTIKYDLNGASGTAPSSQTKTEDVKLILRGKKPSRTGYTFLGWSKNSTAKSATYSPGGVYKANAPATLYAVWKIKTYSVYYSANGGSMAPSAQTKIYGKTLTLRSKIPTRKGHTFLGWSKSSTASRSSYQPGGDYRSNSSVTLYAVWKADTFKVCPPVAFACKY